MSVDTRTFWVPARACTPIAATYDTAVCTCLVCECSKRLSSHRPPVMFITPRIPPMLCLPNEPENNNNKDTRGELELELEGAYNAYLYVQALEICIGSPRRVQDTELEDVRPSGKRDFDLISLSECASWGVFVHDPLFRYKTSITF